MQTVVQSRDAVQAEATAQTNQLSQYIQTLQDQLKETGEALRNQSGEQMSSLADELSMAQNQVTALQQNVADKDATMQQLAERYAQKAQELIELSEDREELKRKNMGEISALQQKLRETTGEDSPMTKDQTLMNLQAELDESYGSQIVMMKQQLEEKRRQEVDLWKQRFVAEQAQKRTGEHIDELKKELESTQDELNTSLTDLEEEKKKVGEAVEELAENALNSSSLRGNLTKEIGILAAEIQRKDEEIQELNQVRINLQDQLNIVASDKEEQVSTYQSQINDLSTEYSHLQKELEQVKEGKEAATVDEDALRNEIEEELRSEYEDRIDDLNFAHEGMLQQVRRELHIEHQEALKKEKRELETQFEQKLENITVTKQHEFVTELQKVKSEIQMQYEKEFEEKLEKENAKWLEASPGPFGGGEQEGRADLSRLRAEVQELSEARDALLTQVDSTNHEKEVLEEELLQVMSEKETLVELPFSPKELGFFSTSRKKMRK
ncbi:putative A-kinase anchor protein 9 isoform X5 [Apostichopus japonicus]|uniref:Putative A-kinase anchor protein 9 isoform X5 n=1 Tax=Stichopus japonicus TaxID=307972 RepID=A0A2G8KPV1_STIJA|nr:putative A-kinase anchor protein 9 isoform X5 [Apostichopus japonicus]